ncbi:PucR family transcriptional regulator [Pseudonocardia spinosispora]|uniref:PucR family transcriptional regulator n=1 Tax=Pseudonocardia spinosispora TaxID=103441 RepID=UPI00041C501B|nr:helix-turn-helix domain-containing protein [Pseudonocardia spinosispora]
MNEDELQPIVDDLANRLHRSVAIDDPSIRLLAASRHFGDEDVIRVRSVLDRAVDPELTERVLAQGITRWVSPGRVDVGPEAGVKPRLCVPVRCNDLLLGFLWLIDTAGNLSDEDIAAAAEAATRAGVVLYRRLLVRERLRGRQEAILRELVSSDQTLRAQAIEDLRAEQVIDGASRLRVLAAQAVVADAPSEHAVAIEAALEEGIRAVPGEAAMMVVHRSRGWLLLSGETSADAAVADRMRKRFRELAGTDLAVGVGTEVAALDGVIDSYRQALLAVKAARLVPGFDGVARWGELGPYDLLLRVPAEDVLTGSHLPEMRRLAEADRHGVLVDTLSAYLDHAGDAQRASDLLCIHRATLYQRLRRIEQVTGCDLRVGDDRLTLHLGLKLHTLAMVYETQSESDR